MGVISIQMTFKTIGFNDTNEGLAEVSKQSISDSCYEEIQTYILRKMLASEVSPEVTCPIVLVKHKHLTSKLYSSSQSNKSKI